MDKVEVPVLKGQLEIAPSYQNKAVQSNTHLTNNARGLKFFSFSQNNGNLFFILLVFFVLHRQ
jgi:hypothetical protein